MKMSDHEFLQGVAKRLILDNTDALEGFASDCRMIGAMRTSGYIAECIREEKDPVMDIIIMYLSEDASESNEDKTKEK